MNDETAAGRAALAAEAEGLRADLAATVGELAFRMTPANLLQEGLDDARARGRAGIARITAVSRDLAGDAADFTRAHKGLLAGIAVTSAAVALLAIRTARRRPDAPDTQTTVPLYAAYAMEDPAMIEEEAPSSWDKVRSEAAHLGAVAGENYAAARDRTAALVDSAAQQAARARDRARAAAGEAGAWAGRQSADHPVGLILAGAAVGILVAALLPARRRSGAQALGGKVEHLARDAWSEARRAYRTAAERLDDVDVPKQAREAKGKVEDLADVATDVLTELGRSALDRLRRAR